MYHMIYSVLLIAVLARALYRRYMRISIAHIPGPKPDSWLIGNANELLVPECGITEAKWKDQFGSIARIRAGFGEDRLYIADPKALQHILQKAGYNYMNLPGDNAAKALSGGKGLFWAHGDLHRLYRKATAGHPEATTFLPVFKEVIDNVVKKWHTNLSSNPDSKGSAVFDVNNWMARAALDVMGKATFDYDFGAVDDTVNPLRTAYDARSSTIFAPSSYAQQFLEAFHNNIPVWLLDMIHQNIPGAYATELRRLVKYTNDELTSIVQERKLECSFEGKKDTMSLLLQSNLNGKARRFSDLEIAEQVYSTIFGGHGTVALSMSWTLFEIAKRPAIQARMRAEILEMKQKIEARGDFSHTALDLEGLQYTDAVLRECFRLQGIIVMVRREAVNDDVLPLSDPIVTASGKVINEIPIAKGTRVWLSVPGYHMNEGIWGEDVAEFKPERWLVAKKTTGMFGNILTFSSGIRSCPGRRFSFVEMQTFLVALLSNFEFSIPEDAKRVVQHRAFAMVPMVEGELERGPQMILRVSSV